MTVDAPPVATTGGGVPLVGAPDAESGTVAESLSTDFSPRSLATEFIELYVRPLPLSITLVLSLSAPTVLLLIPLATIYALRPPRGLRWFDIVVLWFWVGLISMGQWLVGAFGPYALPFIIFTVVWAYTLVFAAYNRKRANINVLNIRQDALTTISTYPRSTAYRLLLVCAVPVVGPLMAGAAIFTLGMCGGKLRRNRSAAVGGLFVMLSPLVLLFPYINMLVILPIPAAVLVLGAAIDPNRKRPARIQYLGVAPLTVEQIADLQAQRANAPAVGAPPPLPPTLQAAATGLVADALAPLHVADLNFDIGD